MIGNRRNFATALVVPAFSVLERWAKENAVTFADPGRARRASRGRGALHEAHRRSRPQDLATFERIKKLALLPNEFSLEAGELTPTLKVKRRVIEERYKDIIEKLYEGAAS